MKVLMVISQFYPIIGGAEKQAQLLARELMKKGHEVEVITGWWSFRTPRKEEVDGIKVRRNFSCWGMFGIKGLRPLGGLTYMASLGIYLLNHGRAYDIIHVHQALYPAFVSVLFGKELLHKPVLVKSASSGMTSDIKQLERLPLGNLQLKYLLKKMDYLIAVSKTSGKEFVEIGYPESRIAYISNGVQVLPNNRIAYAQVTSVLTTARLSREKGIDVLLKAWANVSQHEKTLRLIILGDGPLEPELRRLSETLGIMGSVEFAGMVHNVSKYLKETHLFILPSRTEGVSNALLEAMSHGIPCIATHVGGNAEALGIEEYKKVPKGEYIIGKNGLLVNPDDVKGLSEATLFLIQDGRLREEMGRSSRRFIQENYSIDLVADRYIALYKRMLERRD